jgi:bacteriorhodopsin
MVKHLRKYIGWYIMIPSLYLALVGQSEIWLVILVVLLKMPPFDLIGRYEDWLYKKMRVKEKGLEMREKLKTKPKWVRVLFTVGVVILLLTWLLYGPECELC